MALFAFHLHLELALRGAHKCLALAGKAFFVATIILIFLAGCSPPSEKISPGTTRIRSADDMVMAYVPGGKLQMGSSEQDIKAAFELCTQYWDNCTLDHFSDEAPPHTVILDSYWIDRTEITNDQYQKCVAAGDCREAMCWDGPQFNEPDQQVVCVTWDQARSYCEWAGGRLPTEAEWEYAARGHDSSRYPWGNQFIGSQLNYCDATCGRRRSDAEWNDGALYSAPVGSYPQGASWCGVLDMAGNVSEWVADWYGAYEPKLTVNPAGPASGATRVVRGGSWFLTRIEARAAWRDGYVPDDWYDDLGFRCIIPANPIE